MLRIAVAVGLTIAVWLSGPNLIYSQEAFSVEELPAPAADGLPAELAQKFADKGVRVKSGTGRTICEVWPTKQWAIDTTFQPSEQRLYPFQPGQLMGLVHYTRKSSDFRKQVIPSGWYTLRFALQPVDGNHEGTSITRDFLVLVSVAEDLADKQWDDKTLFKTSGESIGTTHPAMLSLQRSEGGDKTSIRSVTDKEWQILKLAGQGQVGDKSSPTAFDVVIIGHAPE